MYETKPEVTQDLYQIHISSEELFLQYQLDSSKLLSINLLSSTVTEIDQSILSSKVIYSTIKAKAILGIIKIQNVDFLLYNKSAVCTCSIDSCDIYRIKEVDFIPITVSSIAASIVSELNNYLNGLKNLLDLGFFYSFGYDLTSTKQKQAKIRNSKQMNINEYPIQNTKNNLRNIYDTCDVNFFFNYNLYKKFFDTNNQPININFIVPIICGYVNSFDSEINRKRIKFTIITRRNVHHVGTRYNTRGIDDNGHCANYCETEQIINYEYNTLSFTQIRGSVPVFFEQTGMTAQTQITRNEELTVQAFSKHIREIEKDYPLIYCVNLLNRKKEGENIITLSYEKQIRKSEFKNLRYYYFDMQNECKYDNYDRIEYLMQQVNNVLNIFQFFCENESTHEVHKDQTGTIRTNCLDCLDRTNVIQTRISWLVLEKMLNSLNVNTEGIFHGESFFQPSKSKFEDTFKTIWAENGDYISVQYAGTASTITTVTKKGGHDLFGLIQHGVATVSRFYKGTIEDSFKQECFDVLLQKHLFNEFLSPNIENELRNHEAKFKTYHDLLVYIGNWNVGGKEFKDSSNIFEWLLPSDVLPNGTRPDMYIIGFQEIVDLNATNVMFNSNEYQRNKWKNLIVDALASLSNKNDPYVLIKELDLIGIYNLTFIKKSFMPSISNLDTTYIKSGLMGSIGNKGSCMIRFKINDNSFAVACNHLSAGTKNSEARRSEILEILNKTFDKYPNIQFKDYDYYFFFGDINSRINLTIPQCVELISRKDYNQLLSYDQLNVFKKETSIIGQMEEGDIKFNPTYKYIFNANEYDTTKRTPSWCDRILYKRGSNVKVIAYNRCDFTLSDHKPIYGIYNLKTWTVDKEKKKAIVAEIIKENNSNKDSNGFNKNSNIKSNIEENFFIKEK